METNEVSGKAAGTQTDAAGRVVSVDVLRGFDMFWLIGGTGFGIAIARLIGGRMGEVIEGQFEHTKWAGFTFYDLIFPLFVFMVGMSLVFSLEKRVQTGGKWSAYKRLIRRAALMYLMGLVYYGGMLHEWPHIRLLGVLQRLALCYLFGGILFIHLRPRGLIIACLACLVGYWALLSFVPVPGTGETSFEEHANWAWYVDKHFLPGHKHSGDYDPEGLLSTIPAVASCLLGVFAALLLRSGALCPWRKTALFIGGGAALVLFGSLWGLQFPVIKRIWTSSYVLVAGGYSFALLGFLLPGGGRVRVPQMGAAADLDRCQPAHHLHGQEHHRLQRAGRPVRRRRHPAARRRALGLSAPHRRVADAHHAARAVPLQEEDLPAAVRETLTIE